MASGTLKGKAVTIIYSETNSCFETIDHLGGLLDTGNNPKKMSKKAFVEGAQSVVHNYDLRLAEDMD